MWYSQHHTEWQFVFVFVGSALAHDLGLEQRVTQSVALWAVQHSSRLGIIPSPCSHLNNSSKLYYYFTVYT